jgi:transcriptional regulator with XRE-family HTH domain
MKTAVHLIVENIRGLLEAQGKNQGALAFALGKDRSWVNKILNGRRGLDVSELNGIADFFHIETYQLLQPGITHRTERRSGTDRRSGRDRREADDIKTMRDLRARLKLPDYADSPASPLASAPTTDDAIVRAVVRTLVDHARLHQRPDDRRLSRTNRPAHARTVAANRKRTDPKPVKE